MWKTSSVVKFMLVPNEIEKSISSNALENRNFQKKIDLGLSK